MRAAWLVLVVTIAVMERDAGACSCMSPAAVLLTPDRGDDVPLNARVRVEVPASGALSPVVLRVHKGAEVPATTRSATGGFYRSVELTPKKPLEPKTRYEVAYVDSDRHPSTIVFGTFTTGTTTDTAAPRIDAMGSATPHRVGAVSPGGVIVLSSCSTSDPWIVIDGVSASDRAGAQLAFGVWRADPNGVVDDSKPPAATLLAHDGTLTLGRISTCDPHTFALPDKGVVVLGIAAIDEAGNKSATKRLRVDMSAAVP
jgi:hypothetical protein